MVRLWGFRADDEANTEKVELFVPRSHYIIDLGLRTVHHNKLLSV